MNTYWFDDPAIKHELASSKEHQDWTSQEAFPQFEKIATRLPTHLQDKSRIGPMRIASLSEQDDELRVWVYPIDHSKIKGILLGPEHRVQLVNEEGTIFFNGKWKETTEAIFRRHHQFYIYLEPQIRSHASQWEVQKSWYLSLYEALLKWFRR